MWDKTIEITQNPYWKDIVTAFPVLHSSVDACSIEICDDKYNEIKKIIELFRLDNIIVDIVMYQIVNNISSCFFQNCWPNILSNEETDLNIMLQDPATFAPTDLSDFHKFRKAIDCVMILSNSYIKNIDRFEDLHDSKKILKSHFFKKISFLLQCQLPMNYTTIFRFYRAAFRITIRTRNIIKINSGSISRKSKHSKIRCVGCGLVINCLCKSLTDSFHRCIMQLHVLDLLKSLSNVPLMNLLVSLIEVEIIRKTERNFGKRLIPTLENWIDTTVCGWITKMFGPNHKILIPNENSSLLDLLVTLKTNLYALYAKRRIYHLYDIIIRYPSSEPAIVDLTTAFQKTEINSEFKEYLKKALRKKLLTSDMSTDDVVNVYTSAIKLLKTIDPSGFLLTEVTQLIYSLFGSSKNTVHAITDHLVTRSSGEFYRRKKIGLRGQYGIPRINEQKHPTYYAEPKKYLGLSDTITLLLDMCDSNEMFVTEYRDLLAGRLLTAQSLPDIFFELKMVNLIQDIIGKSLMNPCTLMLKDVEMSRSLNKYYCHWPSFFSGTQYNIFGFPLQVPTRAIIMSDHFWPKLSNTFDVNLPPIIDKHLKYFRQYYESLKKHRSLLWNLHYGKINMNIFINNKMINKTVSPIHASIIWHFQDKVEWTLNDLSMKTNIPIYKLKLLIQFWTNDGIIQETSYGSYILA